MESKGLASKNGAIGILVSQMPGNFEKSRLRSRIDECFPSSPAVGPLDKSSQQCVNRDETFLRDVS